MRLAVRLFLSLFAFVGLLVALANVLAEPTDLSAAADPEQLISIGDRRVPLGELLAELEVEPRSVTRAPPEDVHAGPAEPADIAEHLVGADDAETDEVIDLAPGESFELGDGSTLVVDGDGAIRVEWDTRDIYGLAETKLDALRHGEADAEEVLALFASVPRDHPSYARAQRRIGWDVYTLALDEPRRGVTHLNHALGLDPLDGNAWQDLARGYAHTLGGIFH